MSKLKKIAAKFEKLSQVAEYDMGTQEKPDLNNIVKNIQNLIDAFNHLSKDVNTLKTKPSSNDITQQLQNEGITINQ